MISFMDIGREIEKLEDKRLVPTLVANLASDNLYESWLKYKDHYSGSIRRTALKHKTMALIEHDRISSRFHKAITNPGIVTDLFIY
jgi:hypothetical protein